MRLHFYVAKSTRPLCCFAVLLFLLCSRLSLATPLIALKAASNCAGCHQAGRSQRPVLERRCSLDCQGCHIDPSGGTARNQWGQYYSQAALNLIPFVTPQDPLQDKSYFDLHADTRVIALKNDNENAFYPMAADFVFRVRPFVRYLHLIYEPQFLGRIGDSRPFVVSSDKRRFREKFALMVDSLPLNIYTRLARGTPTYGLRRPNHTIWIRQRIGLDQFAVTDATELGATPNVPFFRYSYMLGDPWVPSYLRQKGSSFHGGMRGVTASWHINTSWWDTQSELNRIKMQALGAGAQWWGFIFYGEKNWRKVTNLDISSKILPAGSSGPQTSGVYPSSAISDYEIAYTAIPGSVLGYEYETLDDPFNLSYRNSIFADFHLLPFLQFEIWRRFETGSRHHQDILAILHAYFDF